ncbi:hypothetical protein TraAM80_06795 [Trypanosoma rangeli]|uniref:Uncharacterized protein n=1 Tax=Trypanosoma rangeli TaxID=5698 RepID=A0A3R7K8Q1_TRYRA|nr:uncharacterized protein TraAM80_06795 [Trypanosoma rangeli]RNF01798.1 hypothetical protein TraAM80_06795 [Trypanosoma rangeli]|eukprot:RNF01798.1 hypothetical protein TraAM80_06795 [Trypanosoma rangeli]
MPLQNASCLGSASLRSPHREATGKKDKEKTCTFVHCAQHLNYDGHSTARSHIRNANDMSSAGTFYDNWSLVANASSCRSSLWGPAVTAHLMMGGGNSLGGSAEKQHKQCLFLPNMLYFKNA